MKDALGLIEAVGLAAAYEAADTALKTANVQLIGYELSKGDGMVLVKISGKVAAVQAGVKAAQMSASRVNKIYSVKVIPRPNQNIEKLVFTDETVKYENSKEDQKDSTESEEVIENTTTLEMSEDESESEPESEPEPESDKESEIETKVLTDSHTHENNEETFELNETERDVVLGLLEQSTVTCNICNDPTCPRHKGEQKRNCKHFFKN